MTAIDHVLRQAWTEPFFIKGDFARAYAQEVAIAASLGLITTKLSEGYFGRQWFITKEGLEQLHVPQETKTRGCALLNWG